MNSANNQWAWKRTLASGEIEPLDQTFFKSPKPLSYIPNEAPCLISSRFNIFNTFHVTSLRSSHAPRLSILDNSSDHSPIPELAILNSTTKDWPPSRLSSSPQFFLRFLSKDPSVTGQRQFHWIVQDLHLPSSLDSHSYKCLLGFQSIRLYGKLQWS